MSNERLKSGISCCMKTGSEGNVMTSGAKLFQTRAAVTPIGKERKSIYIAPFWPRRYTQSAQAWITQFYLQITPCLPFLRECSPDGTTTATEAADIQWQLTTHLSTLKGWKAELAWLVDLWRMVYPLYPHKWSPISYRSSAGQRKHAGQRPMFYHWTTHWWNVQLQCRVIFELYLYFVIFHLN